MADYEATGNGQILEGTAADDNFYARSFSNITVHGGGGTDAYYAETSQNSIFSGGDYHNYFYAEESIDAKFNGGNGEYQEFSGGQSINATFNGGGSSESWFFAEQSTGATFNGGSGLSYFYADSATVASFNGGTGGNSFVAGESVDSVFQGNGSYNFFDGDASTGATFLGGEGQNDFYGGSSTGGTFQGGNGVNFFDGGNSTDATFQGGEGDNVFYVFFSVNATFIGDAASSNNQIYFEESLDAYEIVKDGTTATFTWGGNTTTVTDGDFFTFGWSESYTYEDLPCFLPGTLVLTPSGEVAIETLKAGDLVMTHDGEARPVRWLAYRTVKSARTYDPLNVLPIRIRAGALEDNLPARDLYVSPDHALLVDGILIQAGALVNGTSITRFTGVPDSFTYYHVELDDHALIVTEGVAAETFIDNVVRASFDNAEECPPRSETGLAEELDIPRAKAWRQVPRRIHARLAERAGRLDAPVAMPAVAVAA